MGTTTAPEAAADARQVLPTLVALTALTMSLDILQHPQLARCAASALLAAVWGVAFSPELQLRAALGALLYHGGVELLRARRSRLQRPQRRRHESDHDGDDAYSASGEKSDDDDASSVGARDQRVIRWLLFAARVFVWGATLTAADGFSAMIGSRASGAGGSVRLFLARWWNAAVRAASGIGALAGYCEALEVLVLRYFADQEVPYRWHRRAPLWVLSCAVGTLDATGLPTLVARSLLASGVAPLGLVCVLVAGTLVLVRLLWRRMVALVESVTAGGRGRKQRRWEGCEDAEEEEEEEEAADWPDTGHDRRFPE